MLVAILCTAFAGQAWADTTFQRITSTGDLVVGDRYIVVSETNKVAMGTLNNSNKGQGISVSITSNTITIDESTSGIDVFTLGGSAGTYTLRGSKSLKYFGWSSKTDFQATGSLPSGANDKKKYQWNITFSSNNASIANVADNTRLIRGYDDSKDFRAYTTSNGSVVQLYKEVEVTLSSIAISGTFPTTFHRGDTFSHDGMTVTATYDDKSTDNVTASATFSGYNMSSTGVQTVTVSYTENGVTKTATYDITVSAPATLTSIALSGTYPTEFDYGAAFSSEGIVVTAIYDDETNKIVTGDATFSGYNMTSAGAQTVTVSYTENEVTKTATYGITVNAYVQPTAFDINFNDTFFGTNYGGSASGITDSYPESGTLNNVTVTYAGSGNHYINNSQIRFYPNNKLTFEAPSGYNITQIVFTSGGTWTATISANVGTYTSGTKTWTGEATSVLFTGSGSGRCDMSKAAITLAKQKSLYSIAVSGTYPNVFEVGDEFSHEGAVVTATYDDDSNADVTASATFSGYNMSVAGEQTVTVSYTENAVERSTTYDITVKTPAALESIALSGSYPTTFNVGDEFSHEGMTVTATFDDESNADVTASATFSGYDMSAAGEQTVTVSYTHKGATTKTTTYVITVNTVPVSGVTVVPTSTSVKIGKTVSLTPTVTPDNATNKNVTWESSNTSIATVDNGVVTGVATGEATITVKSAADPTKSASCTVTVIAAGDGSKANPYDVDEALEIISEYSSGSGSDGNVYTKGIVSSVGSMYSSTMLTYFISIDGTGENTIQVFRGKNLGNTNFASTSDIKVNDEVIVYGQLYKYNNKYDTTPEINTGNYIYSLNGVKIPEITFGAPSYEVVYNGSLTITATADCSGAITYTSSNETIAEINATTGVVTPHKSGSVTITANVAASVDNIAGSKGVELTVTDGRASAGIEFADATITKTWGEDFTGQDLTNPNSLDVNYESSAPAVATVNASGVVTIVKAGTTTITATFAGDGDYMPAEVSYTLTVNKAAAGLSFSETAFDIDLNDDSFVAPTLNNPNSLTVTYTSSNKSIAVVDENTGELLLDTSAEGTATITASFTENDWYNAGNASYTITIVDPDRKGSKKNPYTVAEVIDGTATGTGIYVKGYIVGEFVGKTSAPRTSGFSGNSNLALADEFSSSPAVANCIPVELPSSPAVLRTDWGLLSNPDKVGYEVLIKANRTRLF